MGTKTKKMGRPKVDSDLLRARFERPVIEAIDDFRNGFDEEVGRPEALRRLVTEALKRRGLLPPD